MPETDILNPTSTWDSTIQDSMNPNYGFARKRSTTQLRKKAVGGTPWTRETQNTGHVFTFSWLARSWACVQRLKWYYEQYEDGFFTIIDHDGGGRHYVGRFTSEVVPVETANNKWDVQNVTFEEMPKVPMLKYPGDWAHDAVMLYVNNDFGDQKLATSGDWSRTSRVINGTSRMTMDNAGTFGDWAQYEYRGYGFQLYLMQGPSYGKADVYLDGVLQATLDCYAPANQGPQVLLSVPNVSLDIHRAKLIVDGTKNASASGANVSWYALQVMR